MLIRGYEVRRTDSFQPLRQMTQMFEMIIDGNEIKSSMTKSVIDKLRLEKLKPQLIISRSVKESGTARKNGTSASTRMRTDFPTLERPSREFADQATPGMKVGYIVTSPMRMRRS